MKTQIETDLNKSDSISSYICDKHSVPSGSNMVEKVRGQTCEARTCQSCPASERLSSVYRCVIPRACHVFYYTVILILVLAHVVQLTEAASSYGKTNRWQSEQESEMVAILGDYGYLNDASREVGPAGLTSREAYVKAVKLFQKWGNINQTGVIDRRTYELMKRPRCGNKDIMDTNRGSSLIRTRHKRYVTAPSKWEKNDLTFRILNTTPDLSEARVHRAIIDAFKVWSDVSPLTFTQVFNSDADIMIQFAEKYHHDGYPFDGKGGVLAHAFFPGDHKGGDTHFDDAEHWNFNTTDGVDLFMVAAHEFGHALGLAHSSNTDALMYPWYSGYTDGFKLPYDDVTGIQSMYGSKAGGFIPTPRPPRPTPNRPDVDKPRPPNRPGISPCSQAIDAITVIRSETFVFIGEMFWRLGTNGIREEPTPTSKFWYGLPEGGVDAVYERADHKIVFFKGDRFWVFTSNELMKNFPKEGKRITELGIDRNVKKIDAVFVWHYNKRTYLITGDMYWKLNEHDDFIEFDYPRDMSIWSGVPTPIDSAFRNINKKNYFFKGDQFWEFYDAKMRTRKKNGTPIGKLFRCKKGRPESEPGTIVNADKQGPKQVSYNSYTDTYSSAPYGNILISNVIIIITVLHSLH